MPEPTNRHDQEPDHEPAHDADLLDEALEETFPASDPIAPAYHRDGGERS